MSSPPGDAFGGASTSGRPPRLRTKKSSGLISARPPKPSAAQSASAPPSAAPSLGSSPQSPVPGKLSARMDKLKARRALSVGPTPAHNPLTEEFASLLLSDEKKPLSTTERALPEVLPPVEVKLSKAEVFGEEGIALVALRRHFEREGRLEMEAAQEILQMGTRLLTREKNLLQLKTPLTVIGDVHGQFYDLCYMLDQVPADTPILFLGDYVDRGYFGCETFLYLMAVKIMRPQQVYLLRGNHESRETTKLYNFEKECRYKYHSKLYESFIMAFEALPLAALVVNGLQERFLCVHGGLSPYMNELEDIDDIDRFGEVPPDGPLADLLWSDPLYQKDMDMEDYLEQRWDENTKRKISWTYGWGVLESFLEMNNLQSLIRAHEVKERGTEEMWYNLQYQRKYAPLYTVFSAPNYCDIYGNLSSYVVLGERDGLRIERLSWQEHPFCLPNFQNALEFSLPFLLTHINSMLVGLLKVVQKSSEAADPAKVEKLEQQIHKIEKWNALSQSVRAEREAIFLELRYLNESGSQEELFRRAVELDATVDMISPLSVSASASSDSKKNRRYSSYF